MPELPEVETIACDLRAASLPGTRIEGVRLLQPLVVRGAASSFRRRLAGIRGVLALQRHRDRVCGGLGTAAAHVAACC